MGHVTIVLREVTREAAEAILAGQPPAGVRVADGYPTEFSAGMAQSVGSEGQFHYFVTAPKTTPWSARSVPRSSTRRNDRDRLCHRRTQQNRGYATAAVEALVAKLREEPAVRRFVAHAPLDRSKSGRVVEGGLQDGAPYGRHG